MWKFLASNNFKLNKFAVFASLCLTRHDLRCAIASVRPKPGFGIGNRNHDQVSVSVSGPELFLPKPKLSPI